MTAARINQGTCRNGCDRQAQRRGLCWPCYAVIPHPLSPKLRKCDICARTGGRVLSFTIVFKKRRYGRGDKHSAGSMHLCEPCWRDTAARRLTPQRGYRHATPRPASRPVEAGIPVSVGSAQFGAPRRQHGAIGQRPGHQRPEPAGAPLEQEVS